MSAQGRYASDEECRALARAIANQAEAIANGTHTASAYAVAQLLRSNVDTLVVWLGGIEHSKKESGGEA
jgi:threonine synthase